MAKKPAEKIAKSTAKLTQPDDAYGEVFSTMIDLLADTRQLTRSSKDNKRRNGK
jgi:hypothetical protein